MNQVSENVIFILMFILLLSILANVFVYFWNNGILFREFGIDYFLR